MRRVGRSGGEWDSMWGQGGREEEKEIVGGVLGGVAGARKTLVGWRCAVSVKWRCNKEVVKGRGEAVCERARRWKGLRRDEFAAQAD